MPTQAFTSSGTFSYPPGATQVTVSATGPGGNGAAHPANNRGGGGGGGAAYAQDTVTQVGSTSLTVTIPAAGSGSPVTVTGGSVTVQANAGANGSSSTGGAGGAAGSNAVAFAGGSGGGGVSSGSDSNAGGGGGGGSGGSGSAGGSGGAGGNASGGAAGTAGTGTTPGAAGGAGAATSGAAGGAGSAPGSGGGGGCGGNSGGSNGGGGGGGQVIISWNIAFPEQGAAADTLTAAVQAPAGDPAAAADTITTGPAIRDAGAAADALAVAQAATADTGGAADRITAAAAITLTDAAAAVDSSFADTQVRDLAGAADVLAVTAVTASMSDAGAAAEAVAVKAAAGASGGTSRPQAYPGTSHVAVAAPGSGYWYDLASIGNLTALTYSFTWPGGCDQMTCTVMVPASYRNQAFNPGWQVKVTRGGHTAWYGKMDEPVPTSSGWNFTAVGAGNLGTNFVATYTDTWPTNQPDEPVNNAISRGLPWVNPGVGQPSGAWFGQGVDPGAQTVTDLLNLVCTRGGLGWYVNSQPGGLIGNSLAVYDLPSTPNRLLVCTTPVPRTLGGDINTIFIRYQISADTTSGTTSTPAVYGLVEVQNTASVAQHQEMETYVDLSDAGDMTSTQAEQVGQYILEVYQRASFAGPFTVQYGQLLNMGGTPVDPGTDQAGTVCRAILTDEALGGEVIPGPVSFITGAYSWDDFALTATVTPFQTLNQNFGNLLSLENTLLTPITAAAG